MQAELLQQITAAARLVSDGINILRERIDARKAEVEAIDRRKLPGIRSAAAHLAEARATLAALIEAHPDAFEKPRTMTISGIKLGLQKQKGKIVIPDKERTVAAIRRHLPDRADDLVRTKEEPITSALNNLTVAELKKIGCIVTEDTDAILIKSTADALDKIVAALLADAETTEEEAA